MGVGGKEAQARRIYIYIYGLFMLLYGRNQYNIVKQLSFNQKFKKERYFIVFASKGTLYTFTLKTVFNPPYLFWPFLAPPRLGYLILSARILGP